ncbi:MAG: hypothetical protein ACE5DR_04130 [Thermodesulfobacteriota bacterium]
MDKSIRIRITKDGHVEIDSTVFTDCKAVAEHLTAHLGKMEVFEEKDDLDTMVRVNIDSES